MRRNISIFFWRLVHFLCQQVQLWVVRASKINGNIKQHSFTEEAFKAVHRICSWRLLLYSWRFRRSWKSFLKRNRGFQNSILLTVFNLYGCLVWRVNRIFYREILYRKKFLDWTWQQLEKKSSQKSSKILSVWCVNILPDSPIGSHFSSFIEFFLHNLGWEIILIVYFPAWVKIW